MENKKVELTEEQKEIDENRKKLAEKIGNPCTGGKGSQRRKFKATHKAQPTDEKKLKAAIKKFGVQPLQGIDEVNMFQEDKTVMHFERPEGTFLFENKNFQSSRFYIEQHFRCYWQI